MFSQVKALIIVTVLTLSSTLGLAQRHFQQSREFGLVFGTAYYIGDLNPTKHFGGDLKFGGGIVYRENVNKRIAIKGSVLYNQIQVYDSKSNDAWQQNRNLHFRNHFIEGALMVEVNFFDYQIASNDAITPYLTAGLAYYGSQPQAEYNGVWYDLQPLGTEGQGTTGGLDYYKSNGIALPMGVGLKMNLGRILGFSFEWAIRKTWTDYFDDVSGYYADPTLLLDEGGPLSVFMADRSLQRSGPNGTNAGMQRGDPGKNDWYTFCHASLNLRLDKLPTSCFKNQHFR